MFFNVSSNTVTKDFFIAEYLNPRVLTSFTSVLTKSAMYLLVVGLQLSKRQHICRACRGYSLC